MSSTITCPSGLAGEIRGLKGKEARLLTDRASAKRGETYDRILRGCWLTTTDHGPYETPENGALNWDKVLLGDRFYVLVRIRVNTFGPEYVFRTQCEVCRSSFEWQINIDDLPVRKLLDADRDVFVNSNRFETEINGHKAWFRLMRGAEEQKITRVTGDGNKEGAIINALMLRLIDIEGIKGQDKRKFLEDLELKEIFDVVDRMDEHGCGVETTIEVECTECSAEQEVSLPFGADFFMPKKRKKT